MNKVEKTKDNELEQVKEKVKRVHIEMVPVFYAAFERYWRESGFASRSECIRTAIRDAMNRREGGNSR